MAHFKYSKKQLKMYREMWPNNPEMWPPGLLREQAELEKAALKGRGRPRTRKRSWDDLDMAEVAKLQRKLKRASKDIAYFIETFLEVADKAGKLVPFKLWYEQRMIVEAAQRQFDAGKPIRLWILKPRQIGSSTVCAGILFWVSIFLGEAVNCRVVAHKRDSSTTIFKHIRRFRDGFPFEALLLPGEKSKTAVSFDTFLTKRILNNEKIEIDPEEPPKAEPSECSRIGIEVVSEAMGRGETIQGLWCSEFAWWIRGGVDLAPGAFGAIKQTIPDIPGTCIIVESTANGMGGMFYDGYWDAVNGRSAFEPVFFPWFDHHEYKFSLENNDPRPNIILDKYEQWLTDSFPQIVQGHIRWRRMAIREKCNNDENFFRQEYPATANEAFISRGVPVFDPETLLRIEREAQANLPILEGDFYGDALPHEAIGGNLRVWEMPKDKHTYCVGADVSHGVRGGDYSVAYVKDVETGLYCAVWRGRVDMDVFSAALHSLGTFYNLALLGVEANPSGGGVYVNRKLLNDLMYPNLMFTHGVTHTEDAWENRPGWYTHTENRETMIQTLSSNTKRGIITLYDGVFVEEAKRFQRDEKTGKARPISGHDDCVMAAAITEMVSQKTPIAVEAPKKQFHNFIQTYINKFWKKREDGEWDNLENGDA